MSVFNAATERQDAQALMSEEVYTSLIGKATEASAVLSYFRRIPVSKAQVARALPGFVGHTEWLEAACGVRRSVMMLAGERLKVALATNHVAFARLRRLLTPARIAQTIVITPRASHAACRRSSTFMLS